MKVLFIASECAPLAKVGGLADVVGALPKALKDLGIDVRVCLPKYQAIDLKKYKFKPVAKSIVVKKEKVDIYQGFLPESLPRSEDSLLRGRVIIYLLENEKYLSRNGIYFDEIQRFLFFLQAILEIFPAINWFPDIIHCHDWHTAIVPLLSKACPVPPRPFPKGRGWCGVKSQKSKVKILLTIHNLAQQGKWNTKEVLSFLNLKGDETKSLKIRDKGGDFNILQQGILNADLINTVSPRYAKEILTKEYGQGLEEWLLKRKKEIFGILNGIDKQRFNPETDPDLKLNYSFQNLEKKNENKIHLQRILNFKKNPQIPLFGFIGRLDSQKGIDLIIEVIPELIKKECQLVILGVGILDYEKKLLELSQKYPQNISSQIKFDSVLAQKIYAGADIFLIPSQFEPCGLVQMIAMRYGAIPIARKTGGLADTIKEGKTGFLFEEYNAKSFLQSIDRALKLYQNRKEWLRLMKKAMKKDFSWKSSSLEYLKLYKKLLNV